MINIFCCETIYVKFDKKVLHKYMLCINKPCYFDRCDI